MENEEAEPVCPFQVKSRRGIKPVGQFVPVVSRGFPGGTVVKNFPADTGDLSLIAGSGRSLGEGNDNPFQYSCLGNPMDRGVTKSMVSQRIGLS